MISKKQASKQGYRQTKFILLAVFAVVGLSLSSLTFANPGDDQQLESLSPKLLSLTENYIELKVTSNAGLLADSGLKLKNGLVTTASLAALLQSPEIIDVSPMLADLSQKIDIIHEEQADRGLDNANLANYYLVKTTPGTDTAQLAESLKELAAVEEAYPQNTIVPPPARTPNFTDQQINLKPAADNGLGIDLANELIGRGGRGVSVADIEYTWFDRHEDLPVLRQRSARINVGTPLRESDFPGDHGTAVASIINSRRNNLGLTGSAYAGRFYMVNVVSYENGYNVPLAIAAAMNKLKPGDIILLEQQTVAHEISPSAFVPIEYTPSVWDAIKLATDEGYIVIEAAGNGNVDLDDPRLDGAFHPTERDSGAIIVGAGSNCDYNPLVRSKTSISSYGSTVDVQGHGQCVIAAGYGSLYGGTSDSNNKISYTQSFNGTSAASATVAGAAAVISSSFQSIHDRAPSPEEMRALMINTGSPQEPTDTNHIGPLPDAYAAVLAMDTEDPTTPASVRIKLRRNEPFITWRPSKDNLELGGYYLYRNGTLIATLDAKKRNYRDTTTRSDFDYSYNVEAFDLAGNTATSLTTRIVTR